MIEANSNALFLSTFGVKIDVKNERKRVSRMCENAYLSIKNPKASRALKQALDPGHRLLTSLARLRFATSATFSLRSWAPPDQILDPHLMYVPLYLLWNKPTCYLNTMPFVFIARQLQQYLIHTMKISTFQEKNFLFLIHFLC